MVPKNEIHLWYNKKVSRTGKDLSRVEVRGVPLAYEVVFHKCNLDGGALMNLKGDGLKEFSEEDISNFFHYLKIARAEARTKLTD